MEPVHSIEKLTALLKALLKMAFHFVFKLFKAIILVYLLIFVTVWLIPASEETNPQAVTQINDVTQMNPIEVSRVYRPTSSAELAKLLARTQMPISIGGGRYSMGGQIGADQSLHLDMRSMNRILELNPKERWVRVEAGATWHDVIEAADQHQLSVQVMQSYSNFTVGGAVSVNAHGRYMGQGAVVHSVQAMKMVLADGSEVLCSRTENPELFFATVGGYGGLGVITEVTLSLVEHTKIKRQVKTLVAEEYAKYFAQEVKGNDAVIMHNGDFFPPNYDEIYVTNWLKTDEAETISEHIQPIGSDPFLSKVYRFFLGWVPGGRKLRPWLESSKKKSTVVQWRNFEASYDVASLGEISDQEGSYILQEYFVPEAQLLSFKAQMVEILTQYQVDVINISIRHAVGDTSTLLSWAPQNAFAFVLYYHQDSDHQAREQVGNWTQALQKAVVEHQGTYYLPYQLWASAEVFHQAYPKAKKYFEIKQRYDPNSRFTNRFLEKYGPLSLNQRIHNIYQTQHLTQRDEQQSYLTVPEWLLVFLSEEQGKAYSANQALHFSYFGGLYDFWSTYLSMTRAVKRRHDSMNFGYHFMIATIGLVTSVEYVLKGTYEQTFGRFFGLFGDETQCHSERIIGETYQKYAQFIHHTPWFSFDFAEPLSTLWAPSSSGGIRCLERKLSFSIELMAKRLLSSVFSFGVETIYDEEELTITLTLQGDPRLIKAHEAKAELIEDLGQNIGIWRVPRYARFTELMKAIYPQVDLIEIAGNHWVVVSVLASQNCAFDEQLTLSTTTVQGDDLHQRVIQFLPVHQLTEHLRNHSCMELEHVYDY